MKRMIILAIIAILALSHISAIADSSIAPPTNIRMTNMNLLNNEEQVFFCPTDSNILIANWRDFRTGFRRVGVGRSTDGGQTWVDSLIPTVNMIYSFNSKQSDPTMTVDRTGSFYMSVLDWDAFGFTNESTIAFYRSDDKGISWVGPYSVLNHTPVPGVFEDKQFITTDRTGGIHDGNLYCAWARFYNGPTRMVFARSLDRGVTFQDTLIVGPPYSSPTCGIGEYGAGQFALPVVDADGGVHVFWVGGSIDTTLCALIGGIQHVVSTDGGATFTDKSLAYELISSTGADGGINTYQQPVVDVDIFGTPFHGNMYMCFTNRDTEDVLYNSDVDFVMSTDNGVTWTDRIQINDSPSPTNNLIDSFHPWLVVNQEGIISVIFYDQRYDAPNYYLFDLMAAYSYDGGATFTVNHRISDVSSSPGDLKYMDSEENTALDFNSFSKQPLAISRAGLLGEYIGLTSYYDKHNAVWTDSRDGNSEVYTANWYLPILEPRLLAPEDNSFQPAQPEFRWATSWKNNDDSYLIEVSDISDFSNIIETQTLDTNFTSFVTSFDDGQYFWRVKATKISTSESSAYSVTYTFDVDGTPPDAPILLSPADGITTNTESPTFDWSVVTKLQSPISYDLYLSTDNSFPDDGSTTIFADLVVSEYTLLTALPDNVTTYWKVIAKDGAGNETSSSINSLTFISYICGDIDNSFALPIISDLTFLVDYLFAGGDEPPIRASADTNGDGDVGISDLTTMVEYLFNGGSLNCSK